MSFLKFVESIDFNCSQSTSLTFSHVLSLCGQFAQKETARQERMKEREKRRKEQQEEVEKKREEERKERMKAASAASGERGEGERYRERERDWGRDGESDKHREDCYRSAGGARRSRSRSDPPPRDRRR